MRNLVLVIAALAGLAVSVAAIWADSRIAPPPAAMFSHSRPPYNSFIAGTGLVEAASGNIRIGTPVGGIVTKVYVRVGETVRKGAPLFKLDDRDLTAALPFARVRIEIIENKLQKAQFDFKFSSSLVSRGLGRKKDKGDYGYDIKILQSQLRSAAEKLKLIQQEIKRRLIRAPIAGKILRINARPGQFATAGRNARPLVLLGGGKSLYVRVNIDEYDAWRLDPRQPAMAILPGNPKVQIPLKFVRIDPFVIPRPFLSGTSVERTDMRVLQALYKFSPPIKGIFIGQRMDVFIKAPERVTKRRDNSTDHNGK